MLGDKHGKITPIKRIDLRNVHPLRQCHQRAIGEAVPSARNR